MPNMVIKDLPPYDGEYPLDITGLTKRELHYVKQVSGVPAGELRAAMKGGDIGVFVAICAVLLKRNGHPDVDEDVLWDAPDDCFQVVATADDKTASEVGRPPAKPTPGGNENKPGVGDSPTETSASSGSSGISDGEPSPGGLSRIGSPGSGLASDSDPVISPI